jgi:hypothetical protein
MIKWKITYKIIRVAVLGILIGSNTKGVSISTVKANTKRLGFSLIIPADLSSDLKNEFEFILELSNKLRLIRTIQYSVLDNGLRS